MPNNEKPEKVDKSNFSKETDNLIAKFESGIISSVTRSSTSSALDMELDDRKKKDELAFKYLFFNYLFNSVIIYSPFNLDDAVIQREPNLNQKRDQSDLLFGL